MRGWVGLYGRPRPVPLAPILKGTRSPSRPTRPNPTPQSPPVNALISREYHPFPLLHTRHNHYLFPTYLDRTTHHVHSSRVHELPQLSLLRYESHWNAGKRLAAHYLTGNIIPVSYT